MGNDASTPETSTAVDGQAGQENPETTQTPVQPGEGQLGDAGKKALDAERRAKRDAERQLAAANQRLKEIEDQGKTELQLATERASKAEQQLAAAQASQLRLEVAAAKGLPANLAGRLQGATREELEADADTLAALIKPDAPHVGLRIDPPAGATQTTSEQSAAKAFFGI